MSAVGLLAEASAAGVSLRLVEGGNVRAAGTVPPGLLDRLRERKAELVELLAGRACRRCGGPIEDRGARAWIPFADGMAAHLDCDDAWYAEDRLRRAHAMFSPEVQP